MVAAPENSGLEKNRGFKKKTQPSGFFGFLWIFGVFLWIFGLFLFFGFFLDFSGFSGFFGVFLGFIYILAQKREFLGFFQFQEYF